MGWLTAILSVLIGAFIGALIEGLQGWPKVFAAILFGSLALLVLLIMGIYKGSMMLWPERDDWFATSSYPEELPPDNPQRALSKNRSERWRSSDPQGENVWFEVDMGKPRSIASIKFITDDDIETPKKWRMMFYRDDDNGQKRTLGHKDGEHTIFVKGRDIPNPVQEFRVEIKEVAEDMNMTTNYAKQYGAKPYWSISLIKLREYRININKRFWEHEV